MIKNRSYIGHETGPESAMTEVALALAMGIFSIMVLAMISMGIGPAETVDKKLDQQAQNIDALVVSGKSKKSEGAAKVEEDDLIVIFHQGQFFDSQLKATTNKVVSEKAASQNSRIVLAIDPKASLEQVLKARGGFVAENLIITQLDQAWIDRLSAGVKP